MASTPGDVDAAAKGTLPTAPKAAYHGFEGDGGRGECSKHSLTSRTNGRRAALNFTAFDTGPMICEEQRGGNHREIVEVTE